MFDIKQIEGLDFSKSKIEEFRCYYTAKEPYSDIGMNGKFFENDETPYFYFQFNSGLEIISTRDDLDGAEILSLDIKPAGEKRFSVRFVYELDGERGKVEFICGAGGILFHREKYQGMSYRNVYSEWVKELAEAGYIESAEYLDVEKTHELEDGFTMNVKWYLHPKDKGRIKPEDDEFKKLMVCELEGGDLKYRYCLQGYNNGTTSFMNFIRHSNGHRYFPFGLDLYGISYLDLDSGEVYNYIPEGFQHDANYLCGESFIITKINYDSVNDLIAYDGCYWSGPSEVMVGDFSEPLSFDPHLVRIHDLVDPEWDEIDDIGFARFEDGKLVVKCDTGEERSVSLDLLAEKIRNFE